uniref:Coagulation factor V n=1 Tax=Nothobranchius furzeri TaxID=105023 RepID=A0A8C6LFP5_NOTFU
MFYIMYKHSPSVKCLVIHYLSICKCHHNVAHKLNVFLNVCCQNENWFLTMLQRPGPLCFSAGLLGPTLRAEEGDTIVVTFRNMATGVYSIHPHGVAYGKQSEGANYFDNTSQKEKEDDMVLPNGEHVYHWEVTPDVSPVPDDPACLTYTYTSHQNVVQDYNSGLIGALLICKPGSLDDSGKQFGFHQEYVFLFGVFDETASIQTRIPFVTLTLPLLLHMAGMSSEPEAFSVHINGQVMTQGGHKVSSVGLISGSSATASLVAPYAGRWLLSSKTMKHIEAGLHGFVDVQKCDNFEEPSRRMTIAQQRQSKEWTYYIAAEEIIWNFSPNLQDHVDADFQRQYLTKSPTHIGAKYKKAVYTLYTNASFTEKLENKQRKSELGILGPVIRAQIRDVIKVVFRNMASRPYSIYPHGLTIDKSEEGVTYPEGGMALAPGETHTYVWNVLTENEPLDKDSRCLTRMYHSAVDTPRDIASGLIGPILICKRKSGQTYLFVQVRADKEQHAMFSVFDENKSWYLDDNIRQNCDWSKVNKADPDFYKSNVMHTINGYGFESGPLLGFCSGEVATWHVSSVGAQDYIQTATFYGHPFELNDRTEEFLSLYPMTGETIKMNMDNTGVWLLASLNSHETTKGMRLKFQDVVCYNNNDYEYEDEDSGKDFIEDYQLYVPGSDPDTLDFDQNDVVANEYEYVSYKDPYSSHEDIKNLNLDETSKYYLKLSGPNVKMYFIAAEEVEWDYAGYGRLEKSQANSLQTKFTKVVFRGYLDSSFSTPDIRGEMDEHLGILGPLIKAEVGQSIMVVFKNNAKRPFSLHPNGVSYTKQFEGLSYEDGSKYWYKYDNEVQPNSTFTYVWKVSSTAGPLSEESQCRTWAYYSGVNPERDIHSGLIGPLLVCREGTLSTKLLDMSEFVLLFMTFDESQSWYYDRNIVWGSPRIGRRHTMPDLKGLRMYTNQLVRWHLLNMGSPKDFQSVHFHGQTFIHKKNKGYRQAVYPLLPGSFATLEMQPSKPGLWQLETEVGLAQQKGMQTLFLVLDKDCYYPLGLESCSVKDNQITAMNTRGKNWEPHLARLNNQGTKNAWSTEKNGSWIQVDFQRPVVISQIATQGAKQRLRPHFVTKYSISYSNDRRKWIHYKGDSRVFSGNQEAYETKKNTFIPPVIARFIRLYPINWYNTATLRMEFYGCELDGCSVPLGLENGLIQDEYMTASSSATNWYFGPWKASLGRLNKQGSVNAWRAKNNDINQWLQVELPHIKKITGIITQGAKFMGKEMYVRSYSLQSSENGIHWMNYMDDEDQSIKIFSGNTNNSNHVKNYIYPPLFSRFIRIIPQTWMNSITMRVELLGCDFE